MIYRKQAQAIRSEELIGSEVVLLPNPSTSVFVLDAAGARIWQALAEGCSPAAIKPAFSTHVHGAVDRFFDDLRSAGLIAEGPGSGCTIPAQEPGQDPPTLVHWVGVSEEAQAAYFQKALDQTVDVAASVGSSTYCYDIAGVVIRVVFASPALEEAFTPHLAHLLIEPAPDQAQVTLHVWDSASSGQSLEAPVSAQYFARDGTILGLNSDRLRIAFQAEDYAVSLADAEKSTGIYWVADPEGLGAEARRFPLQVLLSWVLQWHGRQVLPAALIRKDGKFLLDVAPSGDGHAKVPGTTETLAKAPVIVDAKDQTHAMFDAGQTIGRERIIGILAPPIQTEIGGLDPAAQAEVGLRRALWTLPRSGEAAQTFASCLVARLRASLTEETPCDAADAGRHAEPLAVSVVLPVYNEVRYLRAALQSVADQDCGPCEVLIVDDGSDTPLQLDFDDYPFETRVLRQANAGPSAARNAGIRAARAGILAFLDGDDLWTEGRMKAMLAALEAAPEVDVVMGFGETFETEPTSTGLQMTADPRKVFPFYVGSAVYRRRAFALNGLFDEVMRFAEDTDWFYRARETGTHVRHLGVRSLLVRRHDANMTRNKSLIEKGELRVLKKKHDRMFWRNRTYPDWPRDPWGLKRYNPPG